MAIALLYEITCVCCFEVTAIIRSKKKIKIYNQMLSKKLLITWILSKKLLNH